MGAKSSIEWTDSSWSPIRARNKATGKIGWHCTHASHGCGTPTGGGCYAEAFNKRLGTGLAFKPGHEKDIDIFLDEDMLLAPLRWKKPRRIFVCSMTDLFADFVKDEWIDRLFAIVALCPQHTFQVLTKRSQRMRRYFFDEPANRISGIVWSNLGRRPKHRHGGDWRFQDRQRNLWLGVSAEDQQTADERIPDLLATPAAVRFVSYEPALGPIDFTNHCAVGDAHGWSSIWKDNAIGRPWLDWIIAGGESGQHARPAHPDWFRSVRDQCAAAGVAFFFKQWGEHIPNFELDQQFSSKGRISRNAEGLWMAGRGGSLPAICMDRVGKACAGRLLDGVEHNELPGSRLMGEYSDHLSTIGKRSETVAGRLKIVRYQSRFDGSHRVEFYAEGIGNKEAYDAICEVKRAYEKKFGFKEAEQARPQ